MEKPSGITGNIIGVGYGNTSNNKYHQNPYQKKQQSEKKFRVGEIVKGTIIDLPAPKEAIVKLPIGNLHAVLHGNLKKGDSPMFIVLEIDPSLVLRIFSMPSIADGKQIPSNEIIRILDLPDTQLNILMIEQLRIFSPNIKRDFAFAAYKLLGKIDSSELKNETYEIIFSTIFYLVDFSLDANIDYYYVIKSLFSTKNLIFENLSLICSDKYSNLTANSAIIQNLINQIKKTESTDFIPELLLTKINIRESFISDIKILLSNKNLKGDDSFIKAIQLIEKFLIAQNLVNIVSFLNKQPIEIFLPYIKKSIDAFKVKLYVNYSGTEKYSISGFELMETDNQDIEAIEKLNYFCKSSTLNNLIKSYLMDLQHQINKREFLIPIMENLVDTITSKLSDNQAISKNFTIVV